MATTGVTEGYIANIYGGGLKVNTVKGNDGQDREYKTILFSVGSRRSFPSRNRNGQNGSPEYESDFPLFRANGRIAESVNNNCNIHNADNKLISRRVLIYWEEVTYKKDRIVPVQLQVPYNGQILDVKGEQKISETNTIKVVQRITYLDPNPLANSRNTTAGATTATPVTVTPVAQTQGQAETITVPLTAASTLAPTPITPVTAGANASMMATGAPTNNAFTGMNIPDGIDEELPFGDGNADFNAMLQQMQNSGISIPDNFNPNGAEAPC